MTPTAALYQFWSSFGITAYPSNRVPEDTAFPFITYEPIIANWWTGAAAASVVNVWYHTESEAVRNKKAKEISDRLQGGTTVKCDDGIIFLSQDQPWTPLVDEADSSIVRRYTVITMQFITI